MKVNNSLQQQGNGGASLTSYLARPDVRANINGVLGEKESQRFVASIVSATTVNADLKTCSNASIVSAALLGEALGLSPSPQLGQFYMVPYDGKQGKVAQFQLGYRGYVQLALRSGQYRKLNVLAIKEGELVKFDPLTEEIEVSLIEDEIVREQAETVGYYAFFEYLNGFRKAMYWSKQKMESHALKYSKGYAADKRKGTKWTFWSKDFDGMAYKTMLRQLISKWGIMSTEMQLAYTSDMGVIGENGAVDYIDSVDFGEEQFVEPGSYEVAQQGQPQNFNQPMFGQAQGAQPQDNPPFVQSAEPAPAQGAPQDAQQALFGNLGQQPDNF